MSMIEGQLIVPAFEAHRFRGEYLDCFARIEDHLMPVIERLVTMRVIKKAPHLFGHKFDLILRNTSAEKLWQHRDHVIPLLEELQAFAELRGLVGHAIIKEIDFDGCLAISLQKPGDTGWQFRKVITDEECNDLLAQLKRLTTKLLKQRLTVSAAPASPPPSGNEASGCND